MHTVVLRDQFSRNMPLFPCFLRNRGTQRWASCKKIFLNRLKKAFNGSKELTKLVHFYSQAFANFGNRGMTFNKVRICDTGSVNYHVSNTPNQLQLSCKAIRKASYSHFFKTNNPTVWTSISQPGLSPPLTQFRSKLFQRTSRINIGIGSGNFSTAHQIVVNAGGTREYVLQIRFGTGDQHYYEDVP